jgi:dimethylglycine dehydrogenase
VLSQCSDADLTNASFPWLTAKTAAVAGVEHVRLLRVSYVGELGWELHCCMAELPRVFDALVAAGRAYGLRLFGAYAMNSLRMEKAYRAWGIELTNEVNMIESSMQRFLRSDKDFVGKEATLSAQKKTPRTRLAYMEVEGADCDCRGNEPILMGDRVVGATTGGAYGFTVQKSLTFAYVESAIVDTEGELGVLLLGRRYKARIIAEPAYDPENVRLKL